MKALSHEQMESLASLLIARGLTITRKASTVSMVMEKGATTPKIMRVQGWLSVTRKDLTPELQAIIDNHVMAFT